MPRKKKAEAAEAPKAEAKKELILPLPGDALHNETLASLRDKINELVEAHNA